MPQITVVLCTYNGEKYLEKQLESIVNQSIKPDELIISDDASLDRTCEIIEKYVQQFQFIKFYKNEKNLGFQKNFQQALLKTSGDFIAISDQDDIWELHKLETLLKSFEDNILLVYSDSVFIDESGGLTEKRMSDKLNMIEGCNSMAFINYNCVSGHALMIRNELLNKILPFTEHIFYDQWIAFVACLYGKIKFVNAPLVLHRKHSANSGKVWVNEKFSAGTKLANKVRALESILQYVLYISPEIAEALNILIVAENSNWLKRRYLRLKFFMRYGDNYFAIPKYSNFKRLKRMLKCTDY